MINGYYEYIQIYDLVQGLDDVWLDDCLNDLFNTLSPSNSNYKIALLYQSNVDNLVAVNTAVGITERVPIVWSSNGGYTGTITMFRRTRDDSEQS